MATTVRGILIAGMIAGVVAPSAAQVGAHGGATGRAGRGTGPLIGLETGTSVGIAALSCPQCTIRMNGGFIRVEYGGEPTITAVIGSENLFHVGDALVAVDGALITTAVGGERLNSLPAGQPVNITVRRDGKVMNVSVVPYITARMRTLVGNDSVMVVRGADSATYWRRDSSAFRTIIPRVGEVLQRRVCADSVGNGALRIRRVGCDSTLASARDSGRSLAYNFGLGTGIDSNFRGHPHVTFDTTGRRARFDTVPSNPTVEDFVRLGANARARVIANQHGWLGFGLDCRDCAPGNDAAGLRIWRFPTYPKIVAIDADGPAQAAGMLAGDVLRAIDGVSITTTAGATRFAGLRAGDKVRLTVDRNGKKVELVMTVA